MNNPDGNVPEDTYNILVGQRDIMSSVMEMLSVNSEDQILDGLDKTLMGKDILLDKYETSIMLSVMEHLTKDNYPSNDTFDKIINISDIGILSNVPLKGIVPKARVLFPDMNIIIYNSEGSFAIFSWKSDCSAIDIAKGLGLVGTGSPYIVWGEDISVVETFK